MLGPPRGLWELESTDLGTQSQEEGTQLINVQVVGMDHEAEAAGGCQACMGCMHGTHAWDACMERCTSISYQEQHSSATRKQIFPSAFPQQATVAQSWMSLT